MESAQQVVTPDRSTLEETPEGVLFRRPAHPLEWIALFLISLNFPVEVIQPPELRERIRQVGERALEVGGKAPAPVEGHPAV